MSDTRLKLSRYVAASPSIYDRDLQKRVRVVLSTRTGSAVAVTEPVWQRLTEDNADALGEDDLAILAKVGVLSEDANELRSIVAENQLEIAENRQLYQVIQPTAACQLGCNYCGQAHSNVLLGVNEQDAFLRRVRRRLAKGEYDDLSIGWFGAEPLMGLPVMRRMSPLLKRLAREHNCTYSSSIVTNGVQLSIKTANELVDIHRTSRAEVTLDGPPEIHDQRRYRKKGGGSFDRILQNLIELRDHPDIPLRLIVRCNVDQSNADHVATLIRLLAAHDLQQSVTFYASPVYSWGNDADKVALSGEDFGRREIEWIALLRDYGFPVGLIPGRRKVVCLALNRDGELVDAYGNQFNCTEVSYVPSYGQPNIYSVDPQNESDAPFRRFNKELVEGEHQNCRECSLLPMCGGSCPKLWGEGRIPCPPIKFNISERLVLLYADAKNKPNVREGVRPTHDDDEASS